MATPPSLPTGGSGSTVTIAMAVSGDVEDLKKAREEIKKTKKEMGEWSGAIKTGFSIDVFQLALQSIQQLGAEMKRLFWEGIEWNAMLETQRIGIAAVLRSVNPDSFRSFNSALGKSRELFAELRKEAIKAGIDIGTAAAVFTASTGLMTRKGIPLDRQVALSTLIMRATRAQGLNNEIQLLQESRAILMGENLRGAQVAQSADITLKGLKAAAETGTTEQYITRQLRGYMEANGDMAESYNILTAQVRTLAKEMQGLITEEIFEGFKDVLWAMKEFLQIPIVGTLIGHFGSKSARGAVVGAAEMGMGGPQGPLAGLFTLLKLKMAASDLANLVHPVPGSFTAELPRKPKIDADEEYAKVLWEDYAKEGLKAYHDARKDAQAMFSAVAGAMLKSPAPGGMAAQGLYASESIGRYYDRTLTTQQYMLSELTKIRSLFERAVSIDYKEGAFS